jgi:hypothetical protein
MRIITRLADELSCPKEEKPSTEFVRSFVRLFVCLFVCLFVMLNCWHVEYLIKVKYFSGFERQLFCNSRFKITGASAINLLKLSAKGFILPYKHIICTISASHELACSNTVDVKYSNSRLYFFSKVCSGIFSTLKSMKLLQSG